MRFKKGDKAVLNLHTKMGNCYIPESSHGNTVVISFVYGDSFNSYDIIDGEDRRGVYEEMLKPIMEENGQYLFNFMLAD